MITTFFQSAEAGGDIETAEAQACLQGLDIARSRNLLKVWVEMDCRTVVSLINRREIPANSLIIGDILQISEELHKVTFSWTRRSNNQCAHLIATTAQRNPSFSVLSTFHICDYYTFSSISFFGLTRI